MKRVEYHVCDYYSNADGLYSCPAYSTTLFLVWLEVWLKVCYIKNILIICMYVKEQVGLRLHIICVQPEVVTNRLLDIFTTNNFYAKMTKWN